MKRSSPVTALFIACLIFTCCHIHENKTGVPFANEVIGGGCDGCELMYEGMPDSIPSAVESTGWHESGQKLILTGTVFQSDVKEPAANVIIYFWQTDNKGLYSPGMGMNERAKRHGHIRGWVKTDSAGKYTIRTIRPAPYPNQHIPAHIHLSVKEPGIANEYYTDEINFDDDKLLIPYFKKYPQENRGGSGVVRVLIKDSVQIAEHNIVSGLNIPNYPKKQSGGLRSGLNIGEDQPSFMPYHAFGPDKGTQTCPVCKYGPYHGIIYFAGNNTDRKHIEKWLQFLEEESNRRKKYVKVYFVCGEDTGTGKDQIRKLLEQTGNELHIKNTALTFVPSFSDKESEVYKNRINPLAQNTIVIFKNSTIVDKFIDLTPEDSNFRIISRSLDRTRGEYFDLPAPVYK